VSGIPANIGLDGDTKSCYAELLFLLYDHYIRLLKSSGATYRDLVKGAYGSSGEFTIFLNKLTGIEGRLNDSFRQSDPSDDYSAVISSIMEYSKMIRRTTIEKIYPAV